MMNIDIIEIDNTLTDEISKFGSECQNKYKEFFQNKLDLSFKKMKDSIDSEIKNNISKNIGRDLYNYDEFPDVQHLTFKENNGSVKNIEVIEYLLRLIKNHPSSLHEQQKKIIEQIRINNEKIILHDYMIDNGFHRYFITNRGKLIYINGNINTRCINEILDYDFWIPIDYLKILNKIIGKKNFYLNQKKKNYIIDGTQIKSILELMKNTLYDRKLVPLYVKDIVEENYYLKSLYDKYENDNKLFLQQKEEFETKYKPYLGLIEERRKLDKYQEKLSLIYKKLILENKTLDKEKENLEKKLKEINEIDLENLLK